MELRDLLSGYHLPEPAVERHENIQRESNMLLVKDFGAETSVGIVENLLERALYYFSTSTVVGYGVQVVVEQVGSCLDKLPFITLCFLTWRVNAPSSSNWRTDQASQLPYIRKYHNMNMFAL